MHEKEKSDWDNFVLTFFLEFGEKAFIKDSQEYTFEVK